MPGQAPRPVFHGQADEADAVEMSTTDQQPEFVSTEDEPPASGPADPVVLRQSLRKALSEWTVVIVGAVVVALALRAFLFQAYWIPSESMETTLRTNDRVLVNKISYRLHDVHRGDIVVFERPEDEPGEIRDLIKRVIGLEGDVVEGRGNDVFVNGERLIEPYLAAGEITSDFGPVEVPLGHVFVMGDNRDRSFDSRLFGPIDTERIEGRAFFLFWPLGRAGAL